MSDMLEMKQKIIDDLELLSAREFHKKYILSSSVWYFSEHLKVSQERMLGALDIFKEIISEKLDIHFNNIQIVGSSKTGISLSPYKEFKEFIADYEAEKNTDFKASDIDIALISDQLFMDFWKELRKINHNPSNYLKISQGIFCGFINTQILENFPVLRKRWQEGTTEVKLKLEDKMGISHAITYRIYRNWNDFEDYHIRSLQDLKTYKGCKNKTGKVVR